MPHLLWIFLSVDVKYLKDVRYQNQPSTSFVKSFILDVWLGSECAFVAGVKAYLKLTLKQIV